jgi:stage V sporulation protein R
MTQPLFSGSEWSYEMIERAIQECAIIAKEELHLDTYKNQIEIISSEQMLDAYASVGMPIFYKHWSFGKKFSRERDLYQKGKRGLAYELVINSNPCINYLMEENTACTQVLVIAHAAFGHNHFFKNNHLFKQWTDADGIIDYLVFAKNYVAQCEERYGEEAVEQTLDAAHSLMMNGVDRYKRPRKLSLQEESERQKERLEYLQQTVNDLWRTLPPHAQETAIEDVKVPRHPEENILYFLEKNSPVLEGWQRELLRIVRKTAQYFYPQYQTKVMNEGWASFTHYYIMNRLYEKGLLTDGAMLEFLQLHTSVLWQPAFDSPYYSGMNPYYLGFEIFQDIRRICTEPTLEDQEWFPDLIGRDWLEVCLDAVANYRDESFIRQFLSPHLIRKLRLFLLVDDARLEEYQIGAIHDLNGYKYIRKTLAEQYELEEWAPKIEVTEADIKNTRKLVLTYYRRKGRSLNDSWLNMLINIKQLWGHKTVLQTQRGNVIGEDG